MDLINADPAHWREKCNRLRNFERSPTPRASATKTAALVGKCFKYHNSGGGSDTRWWYYVKVISAQDGGLKCFAFQDIPVGRMEIDTDWSMMAGSFKNGGYKPITRTEFNAAWRKFAAKVKKFPL